MQISSLMYPSIHAKLKGMYAQKLKKADLEELLKQNTTTQAIALLKSLNENFKPLEDNPRRIKIKILLDNMLIHDIQKIAFLLNHTEKEIFFQFISLYEIKCIKSIFRKLSSGSVLNEQTIELENWPSQLFKNLKGISEVKTYQEFLKFIEKTRYKPIFQKCKDKIDEINIFQLENQLDKFYFQEMMKIAKKHNHKLEDMLGKQIDLNNMIWLYRVKENGNFSKEQLRDILMDDFYHLKKSELESLLATEYPKEWKEILQATYYGKSIHFDDIRNLEEQVNQYLYQLYKKCFKGNIFDISVIYAYINMIELENNDIMNIVEGIRYHLSREEIRKKLL